MSYETLISRVERLGGFDRREDAERALCVTLEALGECLVDSEVRALALALPGRAAAQLRHRAYVRDFGKDELVSHVAAREQVGLGFALEHVEAVLGAVGETISQEARTRLKKGLAPAIATLFDARPAAGETPPHPSSNPASARTIAAGRPGSQHPISEARIDRAHSESVARSDNPHGRTKLSSADGLTQEQLEETLATGRPRSSR